MSWLPLDSKMFTSVTYDAGKRILYLRFQSGDIYRYFKFSDDDYQQFPGAESKGRYFLSNIGNCRKIFAGSLADEMVVAAPDAYIATMGEAKRTGKIFIDYFRNDYTDTAIAGYGVRARPGAPVALPIGWKELKNLQCADQFTTKDVLKRAKSKRARSPVPPQTLPPEN
ncbi:MAG TPA: KTSC domain-containing protein [Terriglobales bacterium]|jgi:hypothetical protein